MPASAGSIELSLPADSRYMRLARLMASGVATTAGLPVLPTRRRQTLAGHSASTSIDVETSSSPPQPWAED